MAGQPNTPSSTTKAPSKAGPQALLIEPSTSRPSSPSGGLIDCSSYPESPTARGRRQASVSPPMHVSSSPSTHKLSVTLGKEFHPEMVTISAKEGNRLDVVADLWDREEDCRHEWHVRFPKNDVDMGSIRAVIEEKGELVIDVKRRDCTPQ